MVSSVPIPSERPRYERVAPVLHTVVLIAVVLAVSFTSAHSQERLAHRPHLLTYGLTMAWEWTLFAYAWWGFRKSGVRLREIIGGRWRSPEDALIDVAIAAGWWILIVAVIAVLGHLTGLAKAQNIETARKTLEFLIPRNNFETGLWIALSLTAGFCEEIVFRGYLQRQLTAFAGNLYAGIVLSAVVFGLSHGYEGAARMVMVFALGAMLGVLAHWRRSLRSAMMVHAWQDAFAGLLLRVLK